MFQLRMAIIKIIYTYVAHFVFYKIRVHNNHIITHKI